MIVKGFRNFSVDPSCYEGTLAIWGRYIYGKHAWETIDEKLTSVQVITVSDCVYNADEGDPLKNEKNQCVEI